MSKFNVVHCENETYVREKGGEDGYTIHPVEEGRNGGEYFVGNDGNVRYLSTMAVHVFPADCNPNYTSDGSGCSDGCSNPNPQDDDNDNSY